MLVFEKVALVFRLLEIIEHLLDDLALAPFDVSVFGICIFSAHNVPITRGGTCPFRFVSI